MKKNGFTLMELLVTIGLMALIGVVIGTNMLGLFSNEEDKDYENFKTKIEEAACIYVETASLTEDGFDRSNCRQNGCTITINQLISKGYIADDLKDPSTGENVTLHADNYKVNVTWVNNEKTCSMAG